MTGLALLSVGVLVLFAVATFGMVLGYEFSPDLFQRRQFVYYQLPLLRIQVTPVFRDAISNDLERHLSRSGAVPLSGVPRWDVVDTRPGAKGPRGDAAILCTFLDLRDDDGDLVWLKWTQEHPELAREFWPHVAQVARDGAYYLVPDLFELVAPARDAGRLRQQIAARLAEDYAQLGDVQRQQGLHDPAVKLYRTALKYDPTSAPALRGKSLSLRALGQAGDPGAHSPATP